MKSTVSFIKKFSLYPLVLLAIGMSLLIVLSYKNTVLGSTTTPSFTFTAGGDIGGSANTSATLDLIAQSSSNFHLALGDLSYDEIKPESAWCSFVQSHVGTNFPFELVSGNHEDGGETQNGLIDNFAQCLPDRLGSVGTYGKEYYFDYPASAPIARFIMISPDLTFTNGGYYDYKAGTSHYNWVSNTIDNARSSGVKWVIVGMHKPCISMGVMTCTIGNDLNNLLISKKVDLVLQGHDHNYQRSKQLALNSTTCPSVQAETYNSNCVVNDGSTGTYTKGAGTIFGIIGTVGEGLHTISTPDGDAGYFAKWMGANINPTNGLAKFSVSSDNLTVSASFMGSTAPNNFTDSFSISDSSAPTPAPTSSTISLRSASTGNNGAGASTLTVNTPAGTSSGDVMVAHVIVKPAGNTIVPPTGWTLIRRLNSSSYFSTATYWKAAGSSEPSSYTWTFGSANAAMGAIAGYIGVDNTSPIDASYAQYNNGTSNVDNAGVTTTYSNDMLVYTVGIVISTTVNVPTGFTQEWMTNDAQSLTSEMSQETFASSGATGFIHATHNGGSNSNITHLIALKPVGATAPAPTPTTGSISLRTASSNNNGSGATALNIPTPAGTSSGDVMVAHVVVKPASNIITAPTGWSLIRLKNTSTDISTATYWKVAGSSEPSSYTWTFGTSGQASGGIASYIGVNNTNPVDASYAQYNSGTSNVLNSGVTTTSANDMLVYAVGIVVSTTVNVPQGFTQEWSATSNASTTSEMSQEVFPILGATGTIKGTHNGGNVSNITQLIALRPM